MSSSRLAECGCLHAVLWSLSCLLEALGRRVKTSQQCPRASAEAMGALLLPHSSYVVLNTTDPPGACGAGNGTNRAPEPLPSDITDTGEQSSPLLGQSQLWNHVLLTHGSQLRKLQTEQRENRAPGARSSFTVLLRIGSSDTAR